MGFYSHDVAEATAWPTVVRQGAQSRIDADIQGRAERWGKASHDLLATDFTRVGGKVANVGYAARWLGVPVTLIGHVGDDDLAEQALEPLPKTEPRPVLCIRVVALHGTKTMIVAHKCQPCLTEGKTENAAVTVVNAAPESILVADCATSVEWSSAWRGLARRKI